jgi:hypothetical protein
MPDTTIAGEDAIGLIETVFSLIGVVMVYHEANKLTTISKVSSFKEQARLYSQRLVLMRMSLAA